MDTETEEEVKGSAAQRSETKTAAGPGKFYKIVKRTLDIALSLFVLAVTSPFLLLIAVLIKRDSPGPVIHKRWCESRNGRFAMLKFRTMVENADDLEKFLSPEELEEYKKNIKLPNDPRITKIGRFLRRTSLDEFPQFINVLKGEMSIVGPRPVVPEELLMYGDRAEEILSVKPGITGYWQATGRSNCSYESGRRQEKELYYVRHQSLRLDIWILFKTVTAVFRREGSY